MHGNGGCKMLLFTDQWISNFACSVCPSLLFLQLVASVRPSAKEYRLTGWLVGCKVLSELVAARVMYGAPDTEWAQYVAQVPGPRAQIRQQLLHLGLDNTT